MLNKKYIIIGIITIVIIAGIVIFSRNDSTSDSSELERGIKNLTRDSAADIIKTLLGANPNLAGGFLSGGKTEKFYYLEEQGRYGKMQPYNKDLEMYGRLEEAGFITNVERQKSRWGNNIELITFDFTEKAKPYFVKREDVAADDKTIEVLSAELISVEVTGLTESAVSADGVNKRIADFIATYKATPIGKIIDEETANAEFKWKMPFVLYDDGWRMAP